MDKRIGYLNKYIIFKVLKEYANEISAAVRRVILPLFEMVDPEIRLRFAKYIIKKHELLHLKMEKGIREWVV